MTTTVNTQSPVIHSSERRLSTTAIPSGGMLHMLAQQIKTEFLKQWRIPMFSIPTILFPVLFFFLFGVPNAQTTLPDGTSLGSIILASLSASGLLSIALFSFGVGVASERGQGWMKLTRATPMPSWIYFTSKVVIALLFAVIICSILFPLAIVSANVRMPMSQWSGLTASLLLGMLPFSLVGFTIGYWAGPNSAVAVANVLYLILAFGSGLFIPIEGLPALMQRIAPYLPTYHYGHIVWHAVGSGDGKLVQHIAWLLGTAVVFSLLAIWGYRHDQGKQYG
jgi:ABC-2 type transport system permease protein